MQQKAKRPRQAKAYSNCLTELARMPCSHYIAFVKPDSDLSLPEGTNFFF